MNAAILFFSPSGNTRGVAERIRGELLSRGWECNLTDVTGRVRTFREPGGMEKLRKELGPHDVLLVGGPVYANHLHYTVLDLIGSLPLPEPGSGTFAVPFVTYGGVSSGIALREAGGALSRRGRTVVAGMKVAASHRMTRAFLDRELNLDIPLEPAAAAVRDLGDLLGRLPYLPRPRSVLRSLSCNGPEAWFKATFVFREKKWHARRYPRIEVNADACRKCGLCGSRCPVGHLDAGRDGVPRETSEACIHCMNCAVECPAGAIRLVGDLEKGKAFIAHMIEHHANRERPATAVYPLRRDLPDPSPGSPGDRGFRAMLNALDSPVRSRRMNPVEALKAAGVADARRILEVGCGSGYFTEAAASLVSPGAVYTAIDIHPAAVEETRRKLDRAGVRRMRVERVDAGSTGYPDAGFDLAILFGVIPSPFLPLDRLIPEVLRLLVPGGTLAVWTIARGWNPESLVPFGVSLLRSRGGVHVFRKEVGSRALRMEGA